VTVDLIDYHIHPGYSLDATGSIEEFCQQALKRGLKEICFTTHFDTDPLRKQIDPFMIIEGQRVSLQEGLPRYLHEVKEAQRRHQKRGLVVRSGLEVDYAPHFEEQLRQTLSGIEVDFLLGSIHCLEGVAFTDRREYERCFQRRSVREMSKSYFENLTSLVKSDLFDGVAHLDGYKKYGFTYYGEKIFTAHRDYIEPVLELMRSHGLGIEVNTGALRRGFEDLYPSQEILELIKEYQVKVAALGSDAHHPEEVGYEIKRAIESLEHLGLELTLPATVMAKRG
jgi:histidinol-phosphatase (PHP family)